MSFSRMLSGDAVEALRKEPLFAEKLCPDCQTGEVFPAIRQNRVDFYHKGGKLFSWVPQKGFSTHHKYASVLMPEPKDYLFESALQQARLIETFCEGYTRIKENCALYSGVEASGVAELYHAFSCASNKTQGVVVLDIEVAFSKAEEAAQGHDRIDLVTLDHSTGKLRFFEAKHYSNRASLRSQNRKPALCDQLDRYDGQLKNLQTEIVAAYKMHVAAINNIFNAAIPQPTDIDPVTKAVIFGFDVEQKNYLDKNIITKDNGLKDRSYSVGDILKADLSTMFRGGRQNWE